METNAIAFIVAISTVAIVYSFWCKMTIRNEVSALWNETFKLHMKIIELEAKLDDK